MSDIFIEQIVKRNKSQSDQIQSIASFAVVIIIAVGSTNFMPSLFPIILMVGGFGAYVFSSRKNIEYEYSFTNTELDIDAIYNRSKRKRLFSTDLKDSPVIFKTSNTNYSLKYETLKCIDYSTNTSSDNTYTIIANINNVAHRIIIEPNERLITAFEEKLGSRLFIK